MNKKIFSILLVLVICLSLPVFTFADYKYDAYVHDDANLLSDEEESWLYNLGSTYAKSLQMDVVFLTYDDANGKSTMDYTDDYYDGIEGEFCYADDGILFAIDMDNREIYINTVGLAIRELNDTEIEMFLDYGYNEIANQKYYAGLKVMADKALRNIQSGEDEVDNTYDHEEINLLSTMGETFGVSFGIGLIVVFILVRKHYSANKKTIASKYMDKRTFRVNDKNSVYLGTRTEIKRGYYKQSSSSSSSSRSSGGSSHRSSSGRSHGGGGRKF